MASCDDRVWATSANISDYLRKLNGEVLGTVKDDNDSQHTADNDPRVSGSPAREDGTQEKPNATTD